MAEKIPLKYEDGQHKPFEAGDTLPPETVNLAALIVPGDGFSATPLSGGRVQLDIECCDPCVWQPTGVTRCTGTNVEEQEQDGCGNSRWVDTGTPVAWTPTGEDRCGSNNFIEVEEENQCGDTRWTETDTPCGGPTEPEFPDALGTVLGCCPQPAGSVEVEQYFTLGGDGLAQGMSTCAFSTGPLPWLPSGADAADYELMYEHTSGISQGADGVWFSAASGFSAALSMTGPGTGRQSSFFNLYWRPTGTAEQHLLAVIEMQITIGELCE